MGEWIYNFYNLYGMSKENDNGIGVLGILGIVFVVLKLVGTITWSWWWVLAPFWGGITIAVVLMVIVGIISMLN